MDAAGGTQIAVAKWDFFISYTAVDKAWAEWVAWKLEDAGYKVLVQAWDSVPGSHSTEFMAKGISGAERTLAILSRAYLRSVYGQTEWRAAFHADLKGLRRKLIPVRVEDCDRPDLLGQVVSFDLFGLSDEDASRFLLDQIRAVLDGRRKPAAPPLFPVPTRPDAAPLPTEPPPGSAVVALPTRREAPPSMATVPELSGQARDAPAPQPSPSVSEVPPPQKARPTDRAGALRPRWRACHHVSRRRADTSASADALGPRRGLRPVLRVSSWALTALALAVIASGAGGDSGVAANTAGIAAATVAVSALVLVAFPRRGRTAALVRAGALVGAYGGAVLFNRSGPGAVIGEVLCAGVVAAVYAILMPPAPDQRRDHRPT